MNTWCPPGRRRSRAIPPGDSLEIPTGLEPRRHKDTKGSTFVSLCLCGFSLSRPLFPHRTAVNLLTTEVNLVYLACIGNVLQRVRVEHNEVGALAGRDR